MLIVIEEAHEFLSAERIEKMDTLFQQVARIAKRGRKRWLGLVFVTQLPQHLPRQVFGLRQLVHPAQDHRPAGGRDPAQDGERHRRGAVGPPAGPGARPGHRVVPAPDAAAAGRRRSRAGQTAARGLILTPFSEASLCPSPTPDLIPLRALNQVTYCPRLYYLQYVDCVMPTNEHVEGGLFDHRRVDEPDLANKTRKEGDANRSRGVHLSSETLGISGILDVIEEKDGESYPVETKHGSAPRDDDGRPTVWDNDAVQLCGQALLMEEAFGAPVARGFQFYAGTRERVEVRFTDELRAKTRDAIDQCRDLSAQDAPPDPLPAELRHRCFGCSLAPVCLPEETLYQIGLPPAAAETAEPPPAGLTRVIPQSDDGAVLYVQEPGSHVGKRSEHLVVRKDGQEVTRVPMHAIRQVVVFGNVQVSTQALETLVENEIPVAYLTGYGRFIGTFAAGADEERRPARGAVPPLRRPGRVPDAVEGGGAGEADQPADAADADRCAATATAAATSRPPAAWPTCCRRLDAAASLETVLGLEGQGAALYFGEFGRFLKAQPPGRGFDVHSPATAGRRATR